MPKRIQRKRTKGWRMPAGAVYVGRPTKWGNPYAVGLAFFDLTRDGIENAVVVQDAAHAVQLFRERCRWPAISGPAIRELRGKDLVCWCPLDEPCHADVLLEWANGAAVRGKE